MILFERVGRGLTLTPAGLELIDHVRAMGEAAGRLSLTASGRAQDIEGEVRITASEIYSAHLLPPVIAALRRSHPGISIEIVATNALSDLRRREADIAIRNARPTQPDLIARKLRDDAARLYATPDCLERFGRPSSPEDLARADFIGFDDVDLLLEGLKARGIPLTRANFPVLTGSHLVQWELVRHGVGIGVVTTALGEAEPRVTRALPDLAPIEFPIWLVAQRELASSRRMRVVFDLLAEALSRAPG